MKLIDKFKKAFGSEPKVLPTGSRPYNATDEDAPPIKPGKVDVRHILRFLRGGFRRPAHTRVYRKRGPKLVRIDHEVVEMSHRQARLHFIHTGMREANEIRRSFRERQLEARAA